MIVRFGNVSVSQFEKRIGIKLSQDDKDWFETHRQDNATVTAPDKLHIFDKPFVLQCGEAIVHEAINRLTAYGSENFKERLAVCD